MRTLRFRVASIFLVLLTASLTLVGFVGTKTLQNILLAQGEEQLQDKMGALKAYLKFTSDGAMWDLDHSDPEEEREFSTLTAVYIIADDKGDVHESAPEEAKLFTRATILDDIAQNGKQPIFRTITGANRVPYQVVSSVATDSRTGRKWYLAEGRSLAPDRLVMRRFQANFLVFLPVALLTCAVVSWYSTGAALRSLHSVEQAAQEITGTNLGLQIPKRGADDELDRLIDSFNAMSGRLKRSFDQIRQFSTDVSHELRTPLTAIQGQLEVALFTAQKKEDLQEAVENALQDVERLANLVRALLLLSQSESGQIPMNKTQTDLNDIVREMVDQFQIYAEAEGVHLESPSTDVVLCEVDRTQMERVVTNLLANAIKYTPRGGSVRAWAENDGALARLIVEDTGVGIPPDHLPHIFDRFYRVPDLNPNKGLGLGLSFVSAIVRAHGGEIDVRSEPGTGSRFSITLPVGNVIRTEFAAARVLE